MRQGWPGFCQGPGDCWWSLPLVPAYPAAVRSATIPWALMPRLADRSRSRTPGSRAMHSSTLAWLVRNFQVSILRNLPQISRNRLLV